MGSLFSCDGRDLLVLAVALSVLLAQDQDESQIGRMAAFFTLVGDTLALLALQPGLCLPTEREAAPAPPHLSPQLCQPEK